MLDFSKIIDWLKDYWAKLAISLIVVFTTLIIIFIIKLISFKLRKKFEERASKMITIIYEIIKFVLMVFALFIILDVWDFDTTIGIILFAIVVFVVCLSLVPTICDVIEGIGIIFHGTYVVGDIIEVDGFKGKVINFTILKTKIQDNNGAVKTVSNSKMKEVINYSSDYVTASVYIKLTELERLDEIMSIIDDTLSKEKDEISEIVEGPNLIGLDSFENNVATIKISAKTKACDYYKVMKGLQEYVLKITLEHKIK